MFSLAEHFNSVLCPVATVGKFSLTEKTKTKNKNKKNKNKTRTSRTLPAIGLYLFLAAGWWGGGGGGGGVIRERGRA